MKTVMANRMGSYRNNRLTKIIITTTSYNRYISVDPKISRNLLSSQTASKYCKKPTDCSKRMRRLSQTRKGGTKYGVLGSSLAGKYLNILVQTATLIIKG
jgi:hypothetical protein